MQTQFLKLSFKVTDFVHLNFRWWNRIIKKCISDWKFSADKNNTAAMNKKYIADNDWLVDYCECTAVCYI